MYERLGASKSFNRGSYSFLIAFVRQLETALEERPSELESTLDSLAHAMEFIHREWGTDEASGVADDGSDDDNGEPPWVQDEVESDGAAAPLSERGNRDRVARPVGRAVGGLSASDMKPMRLEHVKPKVKKTTSVPRGTRGTGGGKRRGKTAKR